VSYVVLAARAECPPGSAASKYFSWAGMAVLFLGIITVLLLARKYRKEPGKRLGFFGRLLAWSGVVVLESSWVYLLVSGRKDDCGQYDSALVWVGFAGMLAALFGLLLTMRATWGAIAFIAFLDFGLAISLVGGLVAGNRGLGASIVILLVHGVCTSVATYWSWQLLNCDNAMARARASEAGRTLAAAWVVLVVFGVSAWAFGRDNPSLTLQDNVALSVFVVAAIGLIMGTGYTKYVEASTSYRNPATEPRTPAPNSAQRGLPAVLTVLVVASLVGVRRSHKR